MYALYVNGVASPNRSCAALWKLRAALADLNPCKLTPFFFNATLRSSAGSPPLPVDTSAAAVATKNTATDDNSRKTTKTKLQKLPISSTSTKKDSC